jgi:hypothetical protein
MDDQTTVIPASTVLGDTIIEWLSDQVLHDSAP